MKQRILSTVRQLGPFNAALYAVDVLISRLTGGQWRLYKYQLVAQAVVQQALCARPGGALLIRRARTLAQLGAGFPRRPEVLAERYFQRAQCVAAYRGEELLGFLWFCFGSYQEDEVRARFTPANANAAWDFDVHVLPSHRLGRTFARLWDETNRILRARGVVWSCSRISVFNRASGGAHGRIGATILGSATFLRCGRWQWMVATLPPYFHVSRSDASFPHFRLETPCRTSTTSSASSATRSASTPATSRATRR